MSLTAAAVALMIGTASPDAALAQAPQSAETAQAPAPASPLPDVAPPASVDAAPAEPLLLEPDPSVVPDPGTGDDSPPETVGGEIIVMRRSPPPPGDPLERINEQSFSIVQGVDKALVEPVAKVYNKGLPRPVRQGLRNVFTNLGEPVVFLAFMLELKPGKAFETAGRFLVNTTLGLAGLIDVAKREPFNLPYRANGLANVLGYYGVGPGPFMYLPIIGPTTVRDLIGDTVDNLVSPALLGKPFTKPEVAIPMIVLNQLGERAAFDDEIGRIREQDNPYATYRELYLRQRKAEIEALHGRILPDVVPVYGPTMPTARKTKDAPAEDAAQPPETDTSTSEVAPVAPATTPTAVEPALQAEPEPAQP
ncbi:VacJ family lipoprotein [Novosphingobium profundi]|uniref:MlaA family lipoprotein n=1 Tax=Novosphingobium profundi TaxID=1774954 RepID=UPI001BDA49AA|nr:VacJ family lipoprotein [Novosphingobium profundi]MBT0668029.1 VacJ family lipoprotein [Novosphingobium profundi]